MKMRFASAGLLGCAIVIASPAVAATYVTRAAFDAATSSTTITFDDANTTPEYYPTTYSNTGVTFGLHDIFTLEPTDFAAGAAYGSDYLEWQPAGDPITLTISLPSNVSAIAFDFMELRALPTVFTIGVNGETFNANSSASPSFFGYSATSPFSSLTISVPFSMSSGSVFYFPTIDNFSFESNSVSGAVPEPETWAMMMIGLGLVGGTLRRQRKVSTRVTSRHNR